MYALSHFLADSKDLKPLMDFNLASKWELYNSIKLVVLGACFTSDAAVSSWVYLWIQIMYEIEIGSNSYFLNNLNARFSKSCLFILLKKSSFFKSSTNDQYLGSVLTWRSFRMFSRKWFWHVWIMTLGKIYFAARLIFSLSSHIKITIGYWILFKYPKYFSQHS